MVLKNLPLCVKIVLGILVFGIMYMVFMYSTFYQLDLHEEGKKKRKKNPHVALANLWWNICKNQIENQASLDLAMGIGSAC